MIEAGITTAVVAMGALLVASLMPELPTRERWAAGAAFGPAVGIGLLSLAGFAAVTLALSLPLAAFAFLGGVSIAVALLRRAARRAALPRTVASATSLAARGATLLLLPALAVVAVLASSAAHRRPAGEWDAVAMWNARARLIVRAASEAPEAIRRLDRGQPAHPIYLPMANAVQMAVSGRESVRTPFFTGLWSFLGLLAACAYFAPARFRWLATTALATTPALIFWGVSQCADVALAYGIVIAILGVGSLDAAAGARRIPPLLSGFALGLLPFIKDEGWLFLGAGAWLVLRTWRLGGNGHRQLVASTRRLLLGALPGVVAAVVFKLAWAGPSVTSDFASRLRFDGWLDVDAWSVVAVEYGSHFLDLGASRWSYAWLALALLLALGVAAGNRQWNTETVAVTLCAAVALAWALFFPVSPFGTETHVRQALERLLLQPFPLLVVVALRRLPGSSA